MRDYRAKVNGRVYSASVQEKASNHFRVELDGQVFEIELVGKNEVLDWSVRSGERAVRAQTRALQNDIVETWLAGVPFATAVQAVGLANYPVQTDRTVERRYGGEIRALMPGRVTSILVKETDYVEVGSPLLILEAMKMQNEISSPIVGRVKSIGIREGETVKKDALLMEIG